MKSSIDGSDDKDIHCFKEQKPCHAHLEMLSEQFYQNCLFNTTVAWISKLFCSFCAFYMFLTFFIC